MSKKCWEIRGCTRDMLENCVFGLKNIPCELPCHFAASACNAYEIVSSSDLIDSDADFSQVEVKKQQCFYCKVLRDYLKNQNDDSEK